jgi:hypothetical protein
VFYFKNKYEKACVCQLDFVYLRVVDWGISHHYINPFKLKNMILLHPTLSEVKKMMAVQNTPSSYVYEGYTEDEIWDDEDLGDF